MAEKYFEIIVADPVVSAVADVVAVDVAAVAFAVVAVAAVFAVAA